MKQVEMTTTRQIARWTGVVLIVAGAVMAITPLYFGYAPLAAPAWWGLYFNVFWGGIAVLAAGAVTALYSQYAMREPAPVEEERQRAVITA